MANSYFRFKQFTVNQDRCAMKVCTDACLFGSIAAFTGAELPATNILDIGAGTGLLTLMYAQINSSAVINAVEIDKDAAGQAAENFAASPWGNRLAVHHQSIQQFTSSIQHPFDLVISNPPFFENDLHSDDTKRNLALHSSELGLDELMRCINTLLGNNAFFGVLLPYHRAAYFKHIAAGKGFSLWKDVSVRQTPKHQYFRSILFFSRKPVKTIIETITIKEADNNYSNRFAALLSDYYLYL